MAKKDETAEDLKSQAQKIWLAGLGAFAEAEKKSDKWFRALVKKGKKYETALREPLGQAGETLSGSFDAARSQAGKTYKELEGAVDRGVVSAMKRLGLASRDEVESLRREVASLKKTLKKSAKSSKAKVKTKKAQAKTEAKAKTRRETSASKKASASS